MSLKAHFDLMASYNQWMNDKVYETAGKLSPAELAEDRGAFFRSILGTLNHLVVGDRIWLNRFAMHPPSTEVLSSISKLPHPTRLDQILFEDFDSPFLQPPDAPPGTDHNTALAGGPGRRRHGPLCPDSQ